MPSEQGAKPPFSPQGRAESRHGNFNPDALGTAWETFRMFAVQLMCAGGAGAVAKTAVAPLERVKILLQVQPMSKVPASEMYRGLRDALRRIPQREGGLRALYRGNGANVLRLVPEVGFKFVIHDQFKIMFAPADGSPLGILEKLCAGAATGVMKTLLFYPLDLARTRITADTSRSYAARHYPGVRACLSDTLQREGVRGLYRGVALSMAGIVPYLSVSFTAYDQLKQRLPDDRASRQSWWFPFLKIGCGAAAAASAQALTYPLDTVRRRLQMSGAQGQAQAYWGAVHCVRQMVQKEGVAAFYRGCMVNALKTVPGAAIQFIAYDLIKTTIMILDPTTGVQSPL